MLSVINRNKLYRGSSRNPSISKMELFAIVVNSLNPLAIVTKNCRRIRAYTVGLYMHLFEANILYGTYKKRW